MVDDDRTGGEGERQRKASSSGEVKELPAAGQIECLFWADLKRLTCYLDEIPNLREHLQGKLYAWFSLVAEDWEEYHRDEYKEEGWNAVCQDFGEAPAKRRFASLSCPIFTTARGQDQYARYEAVRLP